MNHRSKRATSIVLWLGIILFSVLGAILYLRLREPKSTAIEEARKARDLAESVLRNAPVRGADGAKVLLVEFGDFQCPYCKDIAPVLEQITQEYSADVRHVWIHLPDASTHPESVQAAVASHCAHRQGAFWRYHDLLFENQSTLSIALFNQIATSLNLDLSEFQRCLADTASREIVSQNIAFAQAQGVDATPYVFINAQAISGAIDYDQLKALIEQEK